MKVLILGGSGLLGQRLSDTIRVRGVQVLTASLRHPQAAAQVAQSCDAIINLAGESIAQRWTPEVKKKILTSRTTSVQQFFEALERGSEVPKHYISASAIGYYGTSLDQIFDEKSPPGTGFLADVCKAWELEATRALGLGLALSIIRTGLVCSTAGGVLAQILPIFRLGLGGRVGNGHQWYSWIHIDDAVGIYLHALDGVEGVLNATAPEPVRNSEFTSELGHALHRPVGIPIPPLVLRLRFGEGATIALNGQRVLPKRTMETGYSFRYQSITQAFQALISS